MVGTAQSISRGEVGNAISGTIELPVNFRSLSRFTNGAPPVTLHAFRVTGPVIREARVSLFWKDDHAIGYVVDGVPPEVPVVLAATIEPGVVARILIPQASVQRPARGQTINEFSDTIVLESYLSGMIPPVGLGGIAEVVRQGGLNPETAASANHLAAQAMNRIARTGWAQSLPEIEDSAAALEKLSLAQLEVAASLASNGDNSPPDLKTTAVYSATIELKSALRALDERLSALEESSSVPAEVIELLVTVSEEMKNATLTDVPPSTAVVPTTGTYNLKQVDIRLPRSPYKALKPSVPLLTDLYDKIGFWSTANTGFVSPNGQPFSETEIKKAFDSGKGPYRTTCSQVNFGGDTNCRIVTNPHDQSREVLITREAEYLTSKLKALEALLPAAIYSNGESKLVDFLYEHPSLTNFIADDNRRWTSPLGTWRVRLLQDVGAEVVGGAGFPVLSDAEMFITVPGKPENYYRPEELASGTLVGVLSIWMPSNELHENLNNFGMSFHWDEQDRTMTEGVLRGERRNWDDASLRMDYSATFNAKMVDNTRVVGYWYNYDQHMAGRFEMIRGNTRYSI